MNKTELLSVGFLKAQGIVDWGYTEDPVPASLSDYHRWLNQSLQGPLTYLSDHRKDLRSDLRKVFPEFQSALVFLFSYIPTKKWLLEHHHHRIAAYALGFEGEDYHHALKRRLKAIETELKVHHPDLVTFLTLDAQPVLERDLAYRAGLGWFGKNSMLISRHDGSYFIIGSLLLNKTLGLEVSSLETDHCGTCTACADACPTKAIDPETRTLRASDCVSTFTIEIMKEADPPKGFENGRGEIFGCDICQDVCPWNRKPLSNEPAKFSLNEKYSVIEKFVNTPKGELRAEIENMTGRGFQKVLSGTALARPGKKGWLKNF